jgi:hypothetical protein
VIQWEEGGGKALYWCMALSFFLLLRASEILAMDQGGIHPDYGLTRKDLAFFKEDRQLSWLEKEEADRVEVNFRAHKGDQKRQGRVMCRTKAEKGEPDGALEILLALLREQDEKMSRDDRETRGNDMPLAAHYTAGQGWKVWRNKEGNKAMKSMFGKEYAWHSWRIGGACSLKSMGADDSVIMWEGRWKSMSFLRYIRASIRTAGWVSKGMLNCQGHEGVGIGTKWGTAAGG